jgi:peptide/nickel transport system permease protein
MAGHILRRVAQAVPMLVGLSVLVFVLLQLAPGSPAVYFLPLDVTDPGQEQRVIAQLGLDQPLYAQYWHWLVGIVQGDFGTAYSYGQPTLQVIAERLGPTLELQIVAICVSVVLAVPVGVIAAVRRYSLLDHVVTSASLFGLSMPNFWFALMLILLFSVRLGWLPTFGAGIGTPVERWPHFVLPVLVLGLATVPWYARFVRSSMLETLQQEYVRSARARGLSESRVVLKHALKPALLPVITIIGLSLPRLIGGSVIVEAIFAWPGLGRLAYDSIQRHDYPVVMALTLLTGAFVLMLNLVVDIVYRWLDPRITYE